MTSNPPLRPNAAWFRSAKWGVIFHYLDTHASASEPSAVSCDEWNRRIDAFDVPRFAAQVREMGAGYVMFTIGQNGGRYCAPNPVFDELAGVTPSRCSRRDLFAEIAQALLPDVRTFAYLPSHAPALDPEVVRALRCTPPWDAARWTMAKTWPDSETADARLVEFQRNWERVIRHWAEKWGKLAAGWWLDGVYFADTLYLHPEEPNFSSLARALRAGNPDRLLAFGSGTAQPLEALCPEQDYTAGEFSSRLPSHDMWNPLGPETNGMQTHLMSFLGGFWGRGGPLRFSDEFFLAYSRYLASRGVVVTWDIPLGETGEIPAAFVRQLRLLKGLRKEAPPVPELAPL